LNLPFGCISFAEKREGDGDLLFVCERFAIEIKIEFSKEGVTSFDTSIEVLGCFGGLLGYEDGGGPSGDRQLRFFVRHPSMARKASPTLSVSPANA